MLNFPPKASQMIHAHLRHAPFYSDFFPGFKEAFSFLSRPDLSTLAVGNYDIDGERIFALVQDYETRPRSAGLWESHRDYLDIQYTVSGNEKIGVAPLGALAVDVPYDPKKDVILYIENTQAEGTQEIPMPPGMFAVFFPQDLHNPKIDHGKTSKVRKIVVKIKVPVANTK